MGDTSCSRDGDGAPGTSQQVGLVNLLNIENIPTLEELNKAEAACDVDLSTLGFGYEGNAPATLRVSLPKINFTCWTTTEHSNFIKGIQHLGGRLPISYLEWIELAGTVGSQRSLAEVRLHAHVFETSIRKNEGSPLYRDHATINAMLANPIGAAPLQQLNSAMAIHRNSTKSLLGLAGEWTQEEQAILDEGLQDYKDDENHTKYIKIASLLPEKTILDVAYRCKFMAELAASLQGGQSAATFSMGGENDDMSTEKQKRLVELLDDNVVVINSIRNNLLTAKTEENVPLMIRFRDNIRAALSGLASMSGNMPPLPVKLNTYFIPPDTPMKPIHPEGDVPEIGERDPAVGGPPQVTLLEATGHIEDHPADEYPRGDEGKNPFSGPDDGLDVKDTGV